MPRPRKKPPAKRETIGDRIRRFRLACGLTQTELGRRVGVTQRVVTYYEVQGLSPSSALLLKLAKTLGVTTDELMGSDPRPRPPQDDATVSLSVWRRIKKLQVLPPNDRKAILKMIDLMASEAAKRKAS